MLGSITLLISITLGDDLPDISQYNITNLNFHEAPLPGAQKAIVANVSLVLSNEYPITVIVPPLRFDILVDGCSPEQPHIVVADAVTKQVEVFPKENVGVEVLGIIPKLPEILITACPNNRKSPLDLLLGSYISGDETTIYVRGSDSPSTNSPQWLTDLLSSVIVPLPFPSHDFEDLIQDFSLADVHFSLPDPFAAPGSPKSLPRLSATVKALVNVPNEMNFSIDVSRVRADANIYYHQKKLGSLDLSRWQNANSTRIEAGKQSPAGLAISSVVKNAPLNITNDDVFAELVAGLIFSSEEIILSVKAQVDVETETALGNFVVRGLPAEGKVFVSR